MITESASCAFYIYGRDKGSPGTNSSWENNIGHWHDLWEIGVEIRDDISPPRSLRGHERKFGEKRANLGASPV